MSRCSRCWLTISPRSQGAHKMKQQTCTNSMLKMWTWTVLRRYMFGCDIPRCGFLSSKLQLHGFAVQTHICCTHTNLKLQLSKEITWTRSQRQQPSSAHLRLRVPGHERCGTRWPARAGCVCLVLKWFKDRWTTRVCYDESKFQFLGDGFCLLELFQWEHPAFKEHLL